MITVLVQSNCVAIIWTIFSNDIKNKSSLQDYRALLWRQSFCYILKDDRDRKILPTEFFKSPVHYHWSYTYSKIDEKYTVTDENHFRDNKAFDCKNTNLRTSRPQLSGNGCQYEEEDSKNKIMS